MKSTTTARTLRLLVAIIAILAAISTPKPARADFFDTLIPWAEDGFSYTWRAANNAPAWDYRAQIDVYGQADCLYLDGGTKVFVPERVEMRVTCWWENSLYLNLDLASSWFEPIPEFYDHGFDLDGAADAVAQVEAAEVIVEAVSSEYRIRIHQKDSINRDRWGINGYAVGTLLELEADPTRPAGWRYVSRGQRRVKMLVQDWNGPRTDGGWASDQLYFENIGNPPPLVRDGIYPPVPNVPPFFELVYAYTCGPAVW